MIHVTFAVYTFSGISLYTVTKKHIESYLPYQGGNSLFLGEIIEEIINKKSEKKTLFF